jgi:predicted ATP-grasp superfamily ATP-dependent carboligase
VGLDCITGLQTARILADRGVPVIGLAADASHFAAQTKVCREIFEVDLSSEALIVRLEQLGPDNIGAVLIPCTDLSVHLISEHRDRLEQWYRYSLPSHDVIELLMDKVRFYAYAEEAGIPIPKTFLIADQDDAERAARSLSYPSVIKPPMKAPEWTAMTTSKAIVVRDAGELLETYTKVRGWAPLLLAQQWVPGGDDTLFSCNAYFDAHGQPLVTFVARKLRQWPPGTGTSSSGEECRNDEILEQTVRLFGAVCYSGLAYLEMKRDALTGLQYVIEPNVGRPTGRSAIAESGGVDLVYTMYCDVVGAPLPANRKQSYGNAKWLDLRRDVQSAVYYWRRNELTARQWLRSIRGPKTHAVISARDPRPFVYELGYAVAKAARPALTRARGRAARGQPADQ